MARQARPRWGWHATFDPPEFGTVFSDEVVARLSRNAGASTEAEQAQFARLLEMAVTHYWFVREREGDPRPTDIAAALRILHTSVVQLTAQLDNLDERSRSSLVYFWQSSNDYRPNEADNDPLLPSNGQLGYERAVSGLEELKATLEFRLTVVPKAKPGRRTNMALNGLIYSLADAYEIGGLCAQAGLTYIPKTREYEGPFVRFVSECLALAAPDIRMTNNALGDAIRRGLGMRR